MLPQQNREAAERRVRTITSARASLPHCARSVLATELYSDDGNQQYGLASAIGVFLVLLVLPAMAFNIRRFRKENR